MDDIRPFVACLALFFAGVIFAIVLILINIKKIMRKWGIKGVLMLCLAAFCIFTPSWMGLRIWGVQKQCMHNAGSIALACRLYAGDHGGNYPGKLDDLVPNYIQDLMIVANPLAADRRTLGYDYFGGKDTDSPDKILIRSQYASRGKYAVVYTDMSGAWIKDSSTTPR